MVVVVVGVVVIIIIICVFWVVTLCGFIEKYQRLKGICYFLIHARYPRRQQFKFIVSQKMFHFKIASYEYLD